MSLENNEHLVKIEETILAVAEDYALVDSEGYALVDSSDYALISRETSSFIKVKQEV